MNWRTPDRFRRVWFTADTHFQHQMLIDTIRLQYATTSDMDMDLIRRWNLTVAPDDLVIHLGDFGMGLPDNWAALCAQLNGTRILVRGNHDRSVDFMRAVGFHEVVRNDIITVDGVRLWLHHYPARRPGQTGPARAPAPGAYDIALCGHVHDAWRVNADGCVNVGVDVWDFAPIDLPRILAVAA